MNLGRRLRNQTILLIVITCSLFILFGVVVHGVVTELQMYHFEEVGRNYIQFVDRTLEELIRTDVEYGFAMSRNETIIEFCDDPTSLITTYKVENYLDEIILGAEDLEFIRIVPFSNLDKSIDLSIVGHDMENHSVSSRFFDTHAYYSGRVHKNELGLLSYNVSLPIHKDNVIIGLVDLSFGLDGFETKFIKDNSYQETGSFIIANSEFEILIQSDISQLSRDELTDILKIYEDGEILNNNKRFFYIKKMPFKNNNEEDHLYFIFAQDQKELFRARDEVAGYTGFMILLFVLIYIVLNMFANRYYKKQISNDTRIVLEETVDYEVNKQTEALRKISRRDSLTKIYNHAVMIEKLEESIRESKNNKEKVCVLMIDIDHFKNINDTYGHPVGDEVLIEVSGMLLKNIRFHDSVGRYGGEEFIVILNETGGPVGEIIAERIRTEISKAKFTEDNIELTVSIGMAEHVDEDALTLIKNADKKLYESKRNGRNRTTI